MAVDRRAGLRERSAAIHVDARPVQLEPQERQRRADLEAIRYRDTAEERHAAAADAQRQRFGIERRRLVAELVGNRQQRSVAQLLAVELVERGRADAVTPKDGWPRPAVKRALDEERAEGVGGPLGGAELLVEPIHEAAGRGRERHRREVDEQRVDDRLAGGVGGRTIALEVGGRHGLIQHQEADDVGGALALGLGAHGGGGGQGAETRAELSRVGGTS